MLPTVNGPSRLAMTGSSGSYVAMTESRRSQEAMTISSSSRIGATGRGISRMQLNVRGGSRTRGTGEGSSPVTSTDSHSSRVTATGPGAEDDYDSENGFTRLISKRRSNNKQFTSRKTGTVHRSVPCFRMIQVCVTRLEENKSPDAVKNFVSELINYEFEVEQLRTSYPSFSSFLIFCDLRHEDLILEPDE